MKTINVRLIAFQGKAFAGKDTACGMLREMAEAEGWKVIEARFAEPLYEMVRALVPQAHSQMGKEAKEASRPELGGLSIREMLISIGEGARQYDPLCWIKTWRHAIRQDLGMAVFDGKPETKVLVLVPDLRKQNEADAFRALPESIGVDLVDACGGNVRVNQALIHLRAMNAPVNPSPNAATELDLLPEPEDTIMVNDHAGGPDFLRMKVGMLWKSLGKTDGRG